MSNICIHVDVNNLYYCVSKKYEARKLDYQKYLDYCRQYGNIHQCYAYGNFSNNGTDKSANGFIHCLQQIGYTTIYHENNPAINNRRNFDCDITLRALASVQHYDTLILGSSNGDLAPLVYALTCSGINTIILAAGISRRLKESCNQYIEIDDSLLEDI